MNVGYADRDGENNIKMDIRKLNCGNEDWGQLALMGSYGWRLFCGAKSAAFNAAYLGRWLVSWVVIWLSRCVVGWPPGFICVV
jgi:hypothetical protein